MKELTDKTTVRDEEIEDEKDVFKFFCLILIAGLVLFVGWLAVVELRILSASCH